MQPYSEQGVADRAAKLKPRLVEFEGRMFDKDVLSSFCKFTASACAPKTGLTTDQFAALLSSMDHMLGSEHTKKELKANVERIIANWHFIYEGMPVPLWDGDVTDGDIQFRFLYRKRESFHNKVYLFASVKVNTGLAAGCIFDTRLSTRQISVFFSRVAGVRKFCCSVEEISGMKTGAVIELQGENLHIHDWKCSTEQMRYNRELSKMRRDARRCPAVRPCNTCHKNVLECSLAIWAPVEKVQNDQQPKQQ